MKIERIDSNKIKITLSIDELESWNVDIDDLSYNTPEVQEMFWTMMKKAEVETGFYVDDSQLIIEAMPLHSDGFVIVITRVEEDEDFESIHKYIKNRFKKSELRVKKKSKKIHSTILTYIFDDFDNVCDASIRLNSMYNGNSNLYNYKNYYYLLLTRNSSSDNSPEDVETILSEYGDKVENSSIIEGFLNEHGEKIIKNNAIETLNNYFSG